MKNSYFTTPRTMADCQFATNADPIEKFGQDSPWVGCLAAAAAAVALIAAIIVLAI